MPTIFYPQSSQLQLYPENATFKLEFDVILSSILNNCLSELGRKVTLSNTFITDKNGIIFKLLEVKEFQDILSQDKSFPINHYHDLTELLKIIELPDYSILQNDALQILQFINTSEQIFSFLNKNKEQYQKLFLLVKDVDQKPIIKQNINNIIDIDGNIKSTASEKLYSIRNSISAIEREIDNNFETILQFCKSKDWLSDEQESIRNGERVLAIISKFKRKIKGVVYDESPTGKTIFIQPESVLNLKNKWFDLKQKEKREIFIILKQLTNFIRIFIPLLIKYQNLAAYFDHIRAKAIYCNFISATMPIISEHAALDIKVGFHPVLLTKNRLIGKKTIPLDIKIDENNRILLISGPNAGGKSVCLKTVGLFQLMIQYGMPIPCHESSVVGIFNKLFVDIGDNQSIEDDLSTYSSRLLNQYFFIQNSDNKTLFLIDEFGSGTEPGTGGIIAEVILEKLNNLNCRGIATTHYTNLKVFAGKTNGLTNAAMLFDTSKLKPLYTLKIGEPGSSFALEILESIGFDQQLILSTKERLQKDELDLNKLLLDLQDKKEISENLINNLQNKEIQLNKLLEENLYVKQDIKSKKNQIITQSRDEAEVYLQKFIKDFEKLVREWKESKDVIKDGISKSIRKHVQITREKVAKDIKAIQEVKVVQHLKLIEGDSVIFSETGQNGTILRIKKEKALVQFGNIKTEIELIKLQKIEKQVLKTKSGIKTYNSAFNSIKMESFTPVLDIRGFRREEAIREVEIYLDKAILHDFNQLRIIHGHGDGILKQAIRSILKQYSFIKNYRSEHADFGGEGVTIIEL